MAKKVTGYIKLQIPAGKATPDVYKRQVLVFGIIRSHLCPASLYREIISDIFYHYCWHSIIPLLIYSNQKESDDDEQEMHFSAPDGYISGLPFHPRRLWHIFSSFIFPPNNFNYSI